MPNMVSDGFIDQAQFIRMVAALPGNADFALQNVVGNAIGNAAVQGLTSCTVNISAYANALVQLLVERLVNMGYAASFTSSTVLSVNWL